MCLELTQIFDNLACKEDLRVAILTATGDSFCAGVDRPRSGMEAYHPKWRRIIRRVLWSIHECPFPVICAINGPALGTGMELLAMSDVVIASETAEFGMDDNFACTIGGHRLVTQILPLPIVQWLLYSGTCISAHEAYRLGAIVAVVPPEKLLEEAWQRARLIADRDISIIREAKEIIDRTGYMSITAGFDAEWQADIRMAREED